MKYNEKNLINLFNQEKSIWQADDLDWFDDKLIHKLQNNQLPVNEKQKMINMMANDQAVMNKYLSLKKQTVENKPWFSQLFQSKFPALIAVGLSLAFVITIVINLNNTASTNIESMRGVVATSIYPIDGSTLDVAPEYFIIQNKYIDEIKINILVNDKNIWSSDYQKSNKFYLPLNIKQQLITGQYNWLVENKNSDINESYSFNIR